ncbi:hypothetical protein E4U55_007346 [Claviceps digitariae]|nr:hypothetical protein E4U55_007346 [Claviceps digitariae]
MSDSTEDAERRRRRQNRESQQRCRQRRRQREHMPCVPHIQDEAFAYNLGSVVQQDMNQEPLMDELLPGILERRPSPQQQQTGTASTKVLSPFDDETYSFSEPIWTMGYEHTQLASPNDSVFVHLSKQSESFQKTTDDLLTWQNSNLGPARLQTFVHNLNRQLPFVHAAEVTGTPKYSCQDVDTSNMMLPEQWADSTQTSSQMKRTPCCRKRLVASDYTASEEHDHNARPEEAIAEVESLYEIGVRVGFLTKNKEFEDFLGAMHRKYKKISLLNEKDHGDHGDSTSGSSSGRDDEALISVT